MPLAGWTGIRRRSLVKISDPFVKTKEDLQSTGQNGTSWPAARESAGLFLDELRRWPSGRRDADFIGPHQKADRDMQYVCLIRWE